MNPFPHHYLVDAAGKSEGNSSDRTVGHRSQTSPSTTRKVRDELPYHQLAGISGQAGVLRGGSVIPFVLLWK